MVSHHSKLASEALCDAALSSVSQPRQGLTSVLTKLLEETQLGGYDQYKSSRKNMWLGCWEERGVTGMTLKDNVAMKLICCVTR